MADENADASQADDDGKSQADDDQGQQDDESKDDATSDKAKGDKSKAGTQTLFDKSDDKKKDDKVKSQADDKSKKSQADDGKSQAGEPFSLEEAKKLRKENKGLRDRLHDFEEAKKKDEDAKLSETQRLTKELADREKKLAESEARNLEHARHEAFLAAASDDRRQVKNSRAVYRLIKDDIEFEDGEISNLDGLLKKAKTEAPELFGAKASGSADGGKGSRDESSGNDMNARIRAARGR